MFGVSVAVVAIYGVVTVDRCVLLRSLPVFV